jgi:hypothetical protein
MKLFNLQRYVPEEFFLGEGIQYFIDENGNDWFKSLSKFNKKYTIAIENETGIIRSISEDAARIYPLNLSIIDIDDLPAGCNILGDWIYTEEGIKRREYSLHEMIIQARQRKSALLMTANDRISPLQDAVDLDIVTEEEKKSLTTWKTYRVLLSRVDPGTAPDIDWPQPPQ